MKLIVPKPVKIRSSSISMRLQLLIEDKNEDTI